MVLILVTDATRNQGGAVVDHLLAVNDDFDVRGLTRDASSHTVQILEDRTGREHPNGCSLIHAVADKPTIL